MRALTITKKRILIWLAVAVPILFVAWWLGSPLFLDTTVNERFPLTASATIPSDMSREEAEEIMANAAAADDAPMSEAMPDADGPAVIKRGAFRDADDFHRGSGTATIYRLEDGSHLLRFEDFRVTNGPDLRVLISPAADVQSRADLDEAGYVELGKLKGNIGSQNYEIPADLVVGEQGSVIIYCRPFHVLFSVSALEVVES
jgi:hypothetical protein